MDAWKIVAGVLVLLGVFQVLASLGAPSLAAGLTTAFTGFVLLLVGFLAFYRAEVDGS
jgi:preprotein translocase subunit SecD